MECRPLEKRTRGQIEEMKPPARNPAVNRGEAGFQPHGSLTDAPLAPGQRTSKGDTPDGFRV